MIAMGVISGVAMLCHGRKSLEGVAALTVVIGIIVGRVGTLGDILSLQSGYAEAIAYIQQQGENRHMATRRPISQIYVGIPNVIPPPDEVSLNSLAGLVTERGYRYLLADVGEVGYSSIATLRAQCQPVTSVRNPLFDFWPLVADQIAYTDYRERAWQSPHRAKIDIFDLRDCLFRFYEAHRVQ